MIANDSRAARAGSARAGEAEVLAALGDARAQTIALVAGLRADQLERTHSPIMSPLVWDLAHIAAYEDLWLVHLHAGAPLLRADLAQLYDAFETPRKVRSELQLLGSAEALQYLAEVRERTVSAIASHGVGDGFVHEMVLRHELQHSETMRQTMRLAGLLPAGETALGALPQQSSWREVPAGPFQMGAAAGSFAYDNERPLHELELDAFLLASRPLLNREWVDFCDDGGYERRELWCASGWHWLQDAPDIERRRRSALHGDPDAPLCHVSWFEADALARAQGARLPTEAEWEKAAKLDADRAGEAPPGESRGALEHSGLVWEWTSSPFDGYPGFEAYPYREYSEVFFGERYRVLRGGSWATSPRVASSTFRNWDLPERSQIFAGVRLARDVL